MYIGEEVQIVFDGAACLVGLCALWVLLSSIAQIYILRRVKYLERLQTADSQAEIEKLKSFYNSCRCVNSRGIIFVAVELLKAIYERLIRVFGVAAMTTCYVSITFWTWVKGLWRWSEKPKVIDVEMGSHRANERSRIPPNRKDHGHT